MTDDIVKTIKQLENLHFLKETEETRIAEAEKELGLSFSSDYREYLANYGVITAKGIELTGISYAKQLSVVAITIRERKFNSNLSKDMYVVEDLPAKKSLIVQNKLGEIFILPQGKPVKKICNSLQSYICSKGKLLKKDV